LKIKNRIIFKSIYFSFSIASTLPFRRCFGLSTKANFQQSKSLAENCETGGDMQTCYFLQLSTDSR